MKSKSDPEFLNFAVKNISELFGYLATGRVNIRICRDITGPPKRSSGKQDVIWGGVELLLFNLLILNMSATPRYYLKLLSLVF